MTRQDIEREVRDIFLRAFEVENPEMDVNLREAYGFDSIDAIELLGKIERFLGVSLSREEKEKAMEIRTINDILDYLETIQQGRAQ